MASEISNEELLRLLSDEKTRNSLLNQPSNLDTFGLGLAKAGYGLYENVNNLTGNVADSFNILSSVASGEQPSKTNFGDNVNKIIQSKDLNTAEKILELGKTPFQKPSSQGGLSYLMDYISPNNRPVEVINRELNAIDVENKKNQALAGQYANGGIGELLSELVMSAPIMKVGNMRRTFEIAGEGSALDVAKAIAKDTLENTGTMGASEFALSKAYGKSDDEAMQNSIGAMVVGGLGTPLVGAVATPLAKATKFMTDTEKMLAEQAGGGVYIKPTPDTLRTKSGLAQDSEEVALGKKAIEDIEYKAVEPKAVLTDALPDQTYVPEVNNPLKFKYGYDDRGRVYTEESSLLSPQGGATQKASLEQVEKPKIESPVDEVNRRLEFYDNNDKLRQAYGQTQAGYKEEVELPKSKLLANRLKFEKDQYAELMKDKSLDKDIRLEARDRLSELNKTRIVDYKPTPEEKMIAKSKFDEQVKLPEKSEVAQTDREIDIGQEYKSYKESLLKSRGGLEETYTKNDKETLQSVIKNNVDKASDIKQAVREVKKKEALEGRQFDASNITDEQRKKYRSEITLIEDGQNFKSDLQMLKDKKITIDEFRYREKRRIDEYVNINKQSKFDSIEEAQAYRDNIAKMYDDIGIKVEDSKAEFTDTAKRTDFKESPEKKAERENKERKESEYSNSQLKRNLELYKNKGEVRRIQSGSRRGQLSLSKSQIEDIDRGILSIDEIADKTNPIGLKAELEDMKVSAKEKANKKIIESERKDLGISENLKPEMIQFKETLSDASNSVAQITTALLSSKSLAKITKLAGKDSSVDIRDVLADSMSKMLPNNFPIKASKDTVKPIFMTENYGQGRNGLIRNIMKSNNVDKQTATEFLDAYNKSFGNLAPEMKELRDVIFDQLKKGKGDISYTMPDGFKVEFKIKKELNGSYSIKGKNEAFKIRTDDLDDLSSAILPNIIHSVDGYVAREMNKKGIATVHDAFQTPKGKTDSFVQEEYGKVMAKVNSSNIIDDILKSMGYEGKSLKKNTLANEDIIESAMSGKSLKPEEVKGEIVKPTDREFEVATAKTREEVMKEFMATGNVRDMHSNQIVKAMTHEAGFRTMSVARQGDDVFERQVALAHQSSKYQPQFAIQAPEGVDKATWNKVQREIFNEARAKLEYNPLLSDVIQGDRKFFTKSGKLVGDDSKTYQELLTEEMRIGRKKNKEYKEIKQRVESKTDTSVLSEDDLAERQLVDEVKQSTLNTFSNTQSTQTSKILQQVSQTQSAIKSTPFVNKNKYRVLFEEQTFSDDVYKEFTKLENMKNVFNNEVSKVAEQLYKRIQKIPEGTKDDITTLFYADYESIRGMTKQQADTLFKDNSSIYQIAKKEIDQGAKALKSQSEQYGAYLNNARLIADRYSLPESAQPIIDKMISIKAMNSTNGWNSLSRLQGNKDLEFILDVVARNRTMSEDMLFTTNPEKIVKGYKSEVTFGNKTLDEKTGKVVWNGNSKYEDGVLGTEMESKKVGTLVEDVNRKFNSLEDELNFMTENRLKKTNGQYRKVADEEIRKELGKVYSLEDVLTETVRSTIRKSKEQGIVFKVLNDLSGDSELYSKTSKDGFVRLTTEQTQRLPFDLRDELKYINPNLMEKLLGRKEIRLYNGDNQYIKVADRLLANLGTAFKQNVVLKNPVSYLNAMLVNQTLGMTIGATPKELLRFQSNAMKDLKEMNNIMETIGIQKLTGKNLDSVLNKKLSNNKLYQMERLGLSTNRVEGVVGDDDLLGSMLKANVPSPVFKVAQLFNINQKTTIGKATLGTFSKIDTMGRYAIVEKLMSKGMSMKDAVQEANGLYGNMDKLVPPAIELLDKYGFVPFLKWFTLTSPKLLQTVKNNPKKAFALGVSIYILGQQTNTNLSSINPIEAMIDFAESATPYSTVQKLKRLGFIDTLSNRANSTVVPKYLVNAINSPSTLGLEKLRKYRIKNDNYKGLTQQIVDEITQSGGKQDGNKKR